MTPRDANADLLAEITALRDRVASLTREKTQADAQATEALEQKTATAEILRVISSSLTDVQPVFDAIASRVVRLCDGFFSTVWRYDGTLIHHAADNYPTEEMRTILTKGYPAPAQQGSVVAQAINEGQIIHVEDLLDDSAPPASRGVAIALGYRTLLCVPMLRDGVSIGAIAVARQEARPFSDRQIELVQTFADQAVIAIENVRLFNETKEALEQQTATSELLKVIGRSTFDLQPVFETLVENAVRLCQAERALIFRFDGQMLRLVATHNVPSEIKDFIERNPQAPGRGSTTARAALERRTNHVYDIQTDPDYTYGARQVEIDPTRTMLAIPMLRMDELLGVITIYRLEIQPFTDKQVALMETFADQAAIAIENARLFKELEAKNASLSESLEQQTATSEILRVIAGSPTNVQPVFESIVRSAAVLCGGVYGAVYRRFGDMVDCVAQYGLAPEAQEYIRRNFPRPVTAGRSHHFQRALLDGAVVSISDIAAEYDVSPRTREFYVRHEGRSVVLVPLVRQGEILGVLGVGHRDTAAFGDRHVELLKTFADQAVIAIENVRLFKELEERNRDLTEALEQQTATSEVLKVISRSTFDLHPVLKTLVETAARLCAAAQGFIWRFDGEVFRLAAHYGSSDELRDFLLQNPIRPGRGSCAGRAALERRTIHVPDVLADPEYELTEAQKVGGYRAGLGVPMLRGDMLIGVFVMLRNETRPFTDKQIELVTTFADQAVIAIENVRLFNETKEALERQTATSEILGVISSSPTDVQPVFHTIVKNAVRLCDAVQSNVQLFDGERMHWVAQENINPEAMDSIRGLYPMRPDRSQAASRAVLARSVVQLPDVLNDSEYHREMALKGGWRSVLSVPMLKEGNPIGVITVARRERFSEMQIVLLQTFADQAVIAIENVRLFTELQTRNRELTEALEQQTATGKILQVISQSQADVQPIFDTIAENALRLLRAWSVAVYRTDGDFIHFASARGGQPGSEKYFRDRSPWVVNRDTNIGRCILDRTITHIPDIESDAGATQAALDAARARGWRSLLQAPMLLDGRPIGLISVTRAAVGSFTLAEIELLKTFANQAVIAVENVRLFKELEGANRELSAASQHKSEFLANMSHELRTPLNAIIGFSEVLTERMFGELNEKQEEYLKDIYASGTHLLSLINDILDLSKIEAGRMELELTDFDLPQAIDNALILIRERAGRRGIVLEHSVDERLGEIRGDERKVRQVLLNLLSNALKFTPEGGRVEVRAGMVDGMAEISVTDTGVGIAPADQEAVFEEFRQVGTAEKKAEGTGLGLTLCRKFVELHGGRIWVKSQLGVGSTFTFTIPVHRDE